ncbi:MAG: hypothetical protein R2844_12735 [Caldilineales bacterium]
MTEQIKVDAHTVEISHPDKVLFPGEQITKRDLVEFYRRIGDVILPHMAGRPISMQRFPDGIAEEVFTRKRRPTTFHRGSNAPRSQSGKMAASSRRSSATAQPHWKGVYYAI